jgi:putative ABC transport system substrate-binding protein
MWFSAIGYIMTLTLSLLVMSLTATAQPVGKLPRIGVLSPEPPPTATAPSVALDAFRQSLRALGYVEEQTILLEYRYAAWQLDRLPALAADLVRSMPDVLFTYSTPGVQAAKQTTTTIPIVVGAAGDLVAQDMVTSQARPSGNITGMTFFGREIEGKCLALLKEAVPQSIQVAVLVNPAHPAFARRVADLAAEAQALGVQLHQVEARDPGEFEDAFAAMTANRAEALLVVNDAMFHAHRHRIVALALAHRLPTISQASGFAEAGGLLQYGVDLPAMFRRAATYVDKLLKGATPADLPVERSDKFELIINLKTAQALGLTFPPHLLVLAEKVIQ